MIRRVISIFVLLAAVALLPSVAAAGSMWSRVDRTSTRSASVPSEGAWLDGSVVSAYRDVRPGGYLMRHAGFDFTRRLSTANHFEPSYSTHDWDHDHEQCGERPRPRSGTAPVPEPTAAMLFVAGLLVVRSGIRRS